MVVRRNCDTRYGNIQGVGRSGVEYSTRLEAGSRTERRDTIRSHTLCRPRRRLAAAAEQQHMVSMSESKGDALGGNAMMVVVRNADVQNDTECGGRHPAQ